MKVLTPDQKREIFDRAEKYYAALDEKRLSCELDDIARHFKVSTTSVRNLYKTGKKIRKVGDRENKRILELYKRNLQLRRIMQENSPVRISRDFGVHVQTVYPYFTRG